MDSRFLGFSIDYQSDKLSFDQFMTDMASTLSHEFPSNATTGNGRNLYFNADSHPDFYIGMVVTVRDQKKFCKGKVANGDFTFDVVNLRKADKVLEFNYFIINKESGLGLYQHYHQSCAPRILGKMLKDLSAVHSRSNADAFIASEEMKAGKEFSNSKRSKLRKPYLSELNFSILVRQEKLQELLTKYKKIKSFEFEYAYLTPDQQAATPLATHVLKKKETLRFHTPTNVANLAASIASFTKITDLKSGRIKVENDHGDEFPIRIFDMPDYFAVYDFDDLADKLANVKASEFYSSKIVDLLLGSYTDEQYDHIFQMKVLDES
ncbi:hypothetical protein O1O06_15830 [Grimontia hollisae]|uniref:hypothetical protein n=1 Tax=Grimontia hollisae TaxID=673 RepID=UPI0023DCB30F|nr:hypothetical protein [Grimontia hollisae]MDF2186210.1 hypothetical protein [Grimontia hollisae]